ncbi:uncharacterized protein LOC107046149 isoform X2 [Diachasma alloeum]|uniref:uncharacterized protein LOC107046149 isoform X2 n=1 Tax=Diachasma alloeum TaxID=454923 RepID=UPI0007381E16|nr:uncharacterized protein LOC107046149 isoform X2 [Diachasma alloeum]
MGVTLQQCCVILLAKDIGIEELKKLSTSEIEAIIVHPRLVKEFLTKWKTECKSNTKFGGDRMTEPLQPEIVIPNANESN